MGPMIQIQLSYLLHLNGTLCTPIGAFYGFTRHTIGLMAWTEAAVVAVEDETVFLIFKVTTVQKFAVTIISIMINMMLTHKITTKRKGMGARKEPTMVFFKRIWQYVLCIICVISKVPKYENLAYIDVVDNTYVQVVIAVSKS